MKGSSLVASLANRLQGKVALITGGASGIGEITARLFTEHGAKVVIADIQDDLGHSLCKEIGTEQDASFVHCNVTSDSDVQTAVNTAVSKYGKLDIMYSNAAIVGTMQQNILESDHEELKKVFEVNVVGGFLAAKHAARVMIPEKKGSIIFTASICAVSYGFPHAYTVSKHGLVGLTKNLCVELGKSGIRVNCISSYAVPTPLGLKAVGMADKLSFEDTFYEAANLKETVLEAKDIAEAALYLASDDSKYVSGLNLIVDGGFTTTNVALAEAMKKIYSQ